MTERFSISRGFHFRKTSRLRSFRENKTPRENDEFTVLQMYLPTMPIKISARHFMMINDAFLESQIFGN